MSDDESQTSGSDTEQPLVDKESNKPRNKKFKNFVLKNVMNKQPIECVLNIEEEAISVVEPLVEKKEVASPLMAKRTDRTIARTPQRRNTDLLDSAEVKDLEWMKRCLEDGSSPEATCRQLKINVCHIAAYYGEENFLELMKPHSELYRRGDAKGRTPFHYAVWEGNLDCLAVLSGLQAGEFQRSEITPRDGKGRKEKVCQEFSVSKAIQHTLNSLEGDTLTDYINLCDSSHSCSSPSRYLDIVWSGCTPLHIACARVQTDCALALLACGADIRKRDVHGRTPLDVCGLANKNLDKIEETSSRGFSKIIEAIIRYGKLKGIPKIEWLTNKNNETSPLHIAVILGSKKATKLLLDIGSLPNLQDETGQTPLHLTIDYKKSIILRAIANFTNYNINHLETRNSQEYTPLQYAVLHEWLEGVSILLDSNANILNQSNGNGQTALHLSSEIGNLKITDMLIENLPDKKNNIDILNNNGETPLFTAILSGKPDCIRCFLHEGAAYNLNFNGFTVLHKAMMSKTKEVLLELMDAEDIIGIINLTDNEGNTPLHTAAKENRGDYINILINKGADPTLKRDSDGFTPLHVAAEHGKNDAIEELLKYEKENLMKIEDNSEWLPFHQAALHCQRDSIEMFLEHGSSLAETVEFPKTGKKQLIANVIKDNMPRAVEFFNHIFNTHMRRNNCETNKPECDVIFNYAIIMNDETENENYIQMSAIRALFGSGCHLEMSKLILHPYIESFLYLKWSILKKFYLIILGIYSIYIIFITDLIVNFFHKDYLGWISPIALVLKQIFIGIVVISIIVLEIPFIRLKGWKYFKRIEGLIKIASVVLGLVIIILRAMQDINNQIRFVVAVALLLSWIEFTMLLSRFPLFGYYFQMFATVALRVTKVFALFGLFLVFGFSLIFWILISQNESFTNPWDSLIKTVVMMTSEFDYSSLIEPPKTAQEGVTIQESEKTSPFVVQLFFILFLICVPIVLMNLLLALAVSDVKDLEIEGKIQRLQEQIEFLSNLEALAWRINIRFSLVEKLRVDNEMTVNPGKPYWDPSNNLPRELMESICENIHNRRSEEEEEKKAQETRKCIEENSSKIQQLSNCVQASIEEFRLQINEIKDELKKHGKPAAAESKAAQLWPTLDVLKAGTSKA